MTSKGYPANTAARVWRQVNLLSLNFASDSAPPGPPVPTAKDIQAMGAVGLDLSRAGWVAPMGYSGTVLPIPQGNWHAQARLLDGPDLRLRSPLGRPCIFWRKDRGVRGHRRRAERFGNGAEPVTGSAVPSTVLADLRQLAEKALRSIDAGESPSGGCRYGIAGVPCAPSTTRRRLPFTRGDQ